MFENLTERLSRTLRNVSGRGRLTEENIKDTLREVRMALLEADVALPVEGGALAMRARRVGVDTGAEVLPLQVAMRVVDGVTVAVTQACYDHPVADEEFDAVVSLLRLNGVEPSEL